jgi:tetratricopeptide (TPR) repeat protein
MLALDQGDVDEACVRLGEALALARAAGDPPLWGVTLAMLGQAARAQGDVGAAASHLAEDLAASRDVAPGVGGLARAWMTIGEGLAALVAGDHDAAGGFFREAIRVLTHEWRSVRMPAHRVILDGLAAVARASGNLARAARLLGATIGSDTDRWGRRQLSVWRPGLDAVALRAAMGEEAFAAAWAEGEAMSPEQASAYALEDDRP